MYRIKLTQRARKELKSLKKLHLEAISEVLSEIKENPSIGKSLTRELAGKFSYKVGNYRIVYKINKKDRVIQIITAAHRSTVYI